MIIATVCCNKYGTPASTPVVIGHSKGRPNTKGRDVVSEETSSVGVLHRDSDVVSQWVSHLVTLGAFVCVCVYMSVSLWVCICVLAYGSLGHREKDNTNSTHLTLQYLGSDTLTQIPGQTINAVFILVCGVIGRRWISKRGSSISPK